ncbi:hypothetical protein T439DRAFT_355782 [Meredithblackwellia eburnea MCA 4105]
MKPVTLCQFFITVTAFALRVLGARSGNWSIELVGVDNDCSMLRFEYDASDRKGGYRVLQARIVQFTIDDKGVTRIPWHTVWPAKIMQKAKINIPFYLIKETAREAARGSFTDNTILSWRIGDSATPPETWAAISDKKLKWGDIRKAWKKRDCSGLIGGKELMPHFITFIRCFLALAFVHIVLGTATPTSAAGSLWSIKIDGYDASNPCNVKLLVTAPSGKQGGLALTASDPTTKKTDEVFFQTFTTKNSSSLYVNTASVASVYKDLNADSAIYFKVGDKATKCSEWRAKTDPQHLLLKDIRARSNKFYCNLPNKA